MTQRFLQLRSASFAARLVLLVAVAVAAGGCGSTQVPVRARSADDPTDERTRAAGLFTRNCVGCHGANGTLGPAPPLADPLWQTLVSDEEIEHLVAAGRPGTLMPAFAIEQGGSLTGEEVRALVQQVRSLVSRPGDMGEVPPLNSTTMGDSQRGAEVFAMACADCHGPEGEGTGGAGPLRDPAFLELISDQALRRVIITGRADLGMPNFSQHDGRSSDFQPLTDQQVADLVALLARWRSDTTE